MHSDGASRAPRENGATGSETDAVITVREAVKDITFGSLAGMISEVFEYPFDLAKVRLQSQLLFPPSDGQPHFKGPLDCLMKTWKNEGYKGLYRGLPVPLVGSMAETAALFVAYSSIQNIIQRYSNPQGSPGSLTIPQLTLAAAGAGAATSFIMTPIELVKCKMQVQMMNAPTPARIPPIHITPKIVNGLPLSPLNPPLSAFKPGSSPSPIYNPHPYDLHTSNSSAKLPGPISIVRSVVKSNGVRGLWLGHTGTILRETGGTAAWFAVKEWVARLLLARRLSNEHGNEFGSSPSQHSTPLLPWESALAGAVSGACCVAALYPADTVKSAMQTEEELRSHRAHTSSAAREWATTNTSEWARGTGRTPSPPFDAQSPSPVSRGAPPSVAKPIGRIVTDSFARTFMKIYRAHGLQGLYAGCGMSMARAVPSSGIVFVVYDGLTAWFG